MMLYVSPAISVDSSAREMPATPLRAAAEAMKGLSQGRTRRGEALRRMAQLR
jgi:hypothetical protein